MTEPMRRIGFRFSYEEPEPITQINTTEEESVDVETPPEIDGIYYDLNGQVFSPKKLKSETTLNRTKSANQILTGISKFILYTALASAILSLSYGVYQKYLKQDQESNIKFQTSKTFNR